MIICNALSLNMLLPTCVMGALRFTRATPELVRACIDESECGAESAIGHADTARIVGALLGVDIPASRRDVKLAVGDEIIVAQYSGPRLPEGATALPEGAKIEFFIVTLTST